MRTVIESVANSDAKGARSTAVISEAREESALDLVFAALADPVRRSILRRLDGEDLLVSELARPFRISLQAVSRHIQVLVRAGLVTQQRKGRISRCRLDAGPIYQAAVWVNHYSKYWQEQFNTLAAWLDEIEREKPGARRQNKSASKSGARKQRRLPGPLRAHKQKSKP
jgi:DNA-binding transcriptional ArsR family regulator